VSAIPTKGGTIPALNRFFRKLHAHSVASSVDTLFDLLNALHSLNDKMSAEHNINLFDVLEFSVMKALRNYFHHEDEVGNDVRIFYAGDVLVTSSLMFMCLIERKTLLSAIKGIPARKGVPDQTPAMERCLSWYGDVVDINPCLFNLGVKICQKVEEMGIENESTEEAFTCFYDGYCSDMASGHNIFVEQGFSARAGEMDLALKSLFGIELSRTDRTSVPTD